MDMFGQEFITQGYFIRVIGADAYHIDRLKAIGLHQALNRAAVSGDHRCLIRAGRQFAVGSPALKLHLYSPQSSGNAVKPTKNFSPLGLIVRMNGQYTHVAFTPRRRISHSNKNSNASPCRRASLTDEPQV